LIGRIVAATDLTARSERALGRALRLRNRFDAQLTVLHVVEEELPEAIAKRRVADAREVIATQLRSRVPGASLEAVTVEIVVGVGYAAIIRRAIELEAGLTVLGSHRESPWRDLFLGSTIERVLRRGDTPILTVRDEPGSDYGRVLVAVDFSVYSRRALEFADRLVPEGEFLVLHAYDLPFAGFLTDVHTRHINLLEGEIREQMAALLQVLPAGRRSNVISEVRLGEAVPVVEAAAAEFRPDLLVVGTHGRTGVAHAILGSIAERLLRRPRCDVLAVRAW
jgi:nucleotide-binding universal stress UspA family protein